MPEGEKEFLGSKRAKIWTYLILGIVLVVAILIFNFVISNPELAKSGIKTIAGLPGWAVAVIIGVLGVFVFWIGLKVETDWPEALGALLIAGAVLTGEIMIGWKKFAIAGIVVIPFLIPLLVFLILLMIGIAKSR